MHFGLSLKTKENKIIVVFVQSVKKRPQRNAAKKRTHSEEDEEEEEEEDDDDDDDAEEEEEDEDESDSETEKKPKRKRRKNEEEEEDSYDEFNETGEPPKDYTVNKQIIHDYVTKFLFLIS